MRCFCSIHFPEVGYNNLYSFHLYTNLSPAPLSQLCLLSMSGTLCLCPLSMSQRPPPCRQQPAQSDSECTSTGRQSQLSPTETNTNKNQHVSPLFFYVSQRRAKRIEGDSIYIRHSLLMLEVGIRTSRRRPLRSLALWCSVFTLQRFLSSRLHTSCSEPGHLSDLQVTCAMISFPLFMCTSSCDTNSSIWKRFNAARAVITAASGSMNQCFHILIT